MNWNVMAEVVMSAVFFAPLLMIFGAVLFVGGLAAFEGVVVVVRNAAPPAAGVGPAVNEEDGPLVASLKAAIEEEARGAREEGGNKEAANGERG